MAPPNGQLVMSISTMEVDDGGAELKSLHPDQNGIFRNIPMMVLGETSRNGEYYDPRSAQEAMTNEKTRFAANIKDGNQEGEWGHPFEKDNLRRIVYIDRTRVSHFISGIRFHQTQNGKTIVYGDVGPTGPFGQYLKESFEDPNRNTSFSIRALSQKLGKNKKAVKIMVTFDAVDGPGFKEASKRYADQAAIEDLSVEDVMDALQDKSELFVTESISDQEIHDLLGTSGVKIHNRYFSAYDERTGSLIKPDSNVHRASAVHEIMRGI